MTISLPRSTVQHVTTGNPDLVRFICSEIEKQGPQSFAWFMQQALYHPEHGYYSSGRCQIGRKGDYFTNVSVGPLFGRLLALQFFEIWERLGKMNEFVIVEHGAHDGQFAWDVLDVVHKRLPKFFEVLRYRILEPFPILKEQQRRNLEAFGDKVDWPESLQPFTGVHFSNELLDAMPVRLIHRRMEQLVALDNEKLVFVQRPHEEGSHNQPAFDWIDDIATNLRRGYIIAIDYGRTDNDFQRSVQVRARHQNLHSPFDSIGEADITISVDWKSIFQRALQKGLRIAGFTDQHHFLTGILSQLESGELGQSLLTHSHKAKRELQTLLHPEMLGRAFQVLALAKNVDPETSQLAGFKFARGSSQSG